MGLHQGVIVGKRGLQIHQGSLLLEVDTTSVYYYGDNPKILFKLTRSESLKEPDLQFRIATEEEIKEFFSEIPQEETVKISCFYVYITLPEKQLPAAFHRLVQFPFGQKPSQNSKRPLPFYMFFFADVRPYSVGSGYLFRVEFHVYQERIPKEKLQNPGALGDDEEVDKLDDVHNVTAGRIKLTDPGAFYYLPPEVKADPQ